MSGIDQKKIKHSRQQFILLVVIFVLPVIAAYVLYQSGWRPAHTGNYGELVVPVRLINDVAMNMRGGKAARFSDLRGKWTLVYFGPASCPPVCQDSLYKMRQIHIGQGKHQQRLQRLFVLTNGDQVLPSVEILKSYPKLKVMTGPRRSIEQLDQQFQLNEGGPLDGTDRIYLLDPLGNLMMSYPSGSDPSKMLKDLGRLLRVSQIG